MTGAIIQSEIRPMAVVIDFFTAQKNAKETQRRIRNEKEKV